MTCDSDCCAAPILWNDLKPQEQELAKRAAIGVFWCPQILGCKQQDMNPTNSKTWGAERTIRACVIRHLALGGTWPEASLLSTVCTESLLVKGALISGELSIRGVTVKRDFWLEQCAFDQMVQLSDSSAKTISFRGSHLPEGLRAKRATIKGSLYLNEGFIAADEVNLEDVTIDGNLECAGGKFREKTGADQKQALNADNAKIGGDVRLKLDSDAASKINFEAWGGVRFVGATISGDFDCQGGHFHNCGKTAIDAGALSCRNLYLAKSFLAEGAVNLIELRTLGQVACVGGEFSNEGENALNLRFADIGSALLFNNAYDHHRKANRRESDLEPASIHGRLDLSHAKCQTFRDSEASWPPSGMLLLDGFEYERFNECPTDWRTRRDWLQRQERYPPNNSIRPQPWTQAVSVLRAMGYDRDSRILALCRDATLARNNPSPISLQVGEWKRSIKVGSFWSQVLRLAVGYGYKPWRAFFWSLAFVAIGWFTFAKAYELGYMAPRQAGVLVYLSDHPRKPRLPGYTEFNSFVYALDVYLPVIELGQDSAWEPSSLRASGLPALPTDDLPASRTARALAFLFRHGVHSVIYWMEEMLGWILVSLFVAGMSGIMKKE